VADFLITCIQQENIAIKSKQVYLIALAYLSRYLKDKLKNEKSFEEITADDLSKFLNSFHPNDPNEDLKQSWINTQKTWGHPIKKFFKWLAYPTLSPQERKRLPQDKQPHVLRGLILQKKKGSTSPVTAKDIWDDKDIAVFLKHCKDKPRLRFYTALAYETSARPGELLQLRIGDIANNIQQDENGKLCALVDVGRYGKKKESRIVGITPLSIQYYQAYLPHHPDPTNPKAFIFINMENSAISRNFPISDNALRKDFSSFRDKKIPKLLKREDISEEDKKHLEFMKNTKKWYPYIIRHSSLTKLAPNVKEYRLREHAGWSKRSEMVEVYTHTLTGDSAEDVLMFYGVNLKGGKKKRNEKLQQEMVGPHCPYCHTANLPDTQLCSSCGRPISSITYDAVVRESENTRRELEELKASQDELSADVKNELRFVMNLLRQRKEEEEAKKKKKEVAGATATTATAAAAEEEKQ
jgi:integrase